MPSSIENNVIVGNDVDITLWDLENKLETEALHEVVEFGVKDPPTLKPKRNKHQKQGHIKEG